MNQTKYLRSVFSYQNAAGSMTRPDRPLAGVPGLVGARKLRQSADSPDGLKRNRGKRGFDVIQRLQRIPKVTVLIHDGDFPQVREVDRKLIELAKAMDAKVVTNDYNLNKVAELSGVAYLDDGTMVVVDHGRKLIGQSVDATVTSVLQTTAGRMIFARPVPSAEEPE